eukprot:gnl/Ergobibamus_cyprinoides/1345.p2 GENE.gnl/Ergobibamus_cyprinoides/1345~~gnl/Ergobibamus_cyprinoides/1345.p2  ORF type:complete len:230 (+),score=22.37 gnl/Ergobibamus_cyprinoides/1345:211-900(+)
MAAISFAVDYWSSGTAQALFLEHEGFLGAVGAGACAARRSPELATARASDHDLSRSHQSALFCRGFYHRIRAVVSAVVALILLLLRPWSEHARLRLAHAVMPPTPSPEAPPPPFAFKTVPGAEIALPHDAARRGKTSPAPSSRQAVSSQPHANSRVFSAAQFGLLSSVLAVHDEDDDQPPFPIHRDSSLHPRPSSTPGTRSDGEGAGRMLITPPCACRACALLRARNHH